MNCVGNVRVNDLIYLASLTPISRCLLLKIRDWRSFSSRRRLSIAACSFRSHGKSSLYIILAGLRFFDAKLVQIKNNILNC